MAQEYGTVPPANMLYGALDLGQVRTSIPIDSAFIKGTSGDCWFVRINALKGQSSATLTLYAYVIAVTNSPDFQMQVWDGAQGAEDDDRPSTSTSNLASSPSTLSLTNADDATWVSLTCTVSLTQSQTYFLIVENVSTDETTDYATFRTRGYMDHLNGAQLSTLGQTFRVGTDSNGFTTDPSYESSGSCAVVKYSDGTLSGVPYIVSATTANDTTDKGCRFKFSEDVSIVGFGLAVGESATSVMHIYPAGNGTPVVSVTLDRYQQFNAAVAVCDPVTLTGGTEYDFIMEFATAGNPVTAWMGEAEGSLPADILACRPQSFGYVTTTGAAGSYPTGIAVDTSKILPFGIAIDNNPAIAGGGGGAAPVITGAGR